MEREETDLIGAAASGDGEAFGRLVERHTGWLLGRVAGKLGNRTDAEDLVQDTFLAAYRQLPGLRDPGQFGAWLAGIADNKLRMWHRRQAVQLRWLEANGTAGEDGPQADAFDDPPAIRGLIRRAIGRLTSTQREVVVRHYLKGYSYQQVSEFLGVEAGTVRSRLQKARKRLQQEVIAMADRPVKPDRFELEGRDARALRSAIELVSRDPNRPILQAICLDAGGWIVVTDGARLFRWRAEGLAALVAPTVLGPWSGVELPGEDESTTLILGEDEATLHTAGADIAVGVMEGPFVKYEEAIGQPGPVEATMCGRELLGSLKEIGPFLGRRHPLDDLPGWDYRPIVRITVSSLEQGIDLTTTRDLGYLSPTEEGLEEEPGGPQWEFSARTSADVGGLAEGETRRFGVNAEYLQQLIRALDLEDGEEVRMHLGDERSAVHFTVPGSADRSAVLMPVKQVESAG